MDDELLDEILMYKRDFDLNIQKATSTLISKHMQCYPLEWIKKRRREYLETISDEIRFDILVESARLEKYSEKGDPLGVALTKETIKEMSNRLDKIDKELYFVEHPGENIQDKIQMAKEIPFSNFLEFNKHGQAVCPFHGDKDPSLKWYPKTNTVHCFSCQKTWDTIQFVRDLDGLTFMEAISCCLATV